MKLLIISQGIPHPTRGGSPILIWHAVKALQAAGYEIRQILILGERDTIEPAWEHREASGLTTATARCPLVVTRTSIKLKHPLVYSDWADIVLCFDILSAWAAKDIPGRKVVWLGDLNWQTHLWHAWYAFREDWTQVAGIPLMAYRGRLWKRIYRDALEGCEVICCGGSSVKELGKIGVTARYLPFPWPTEPAIRPAGPKPAKPTFLFFGQLNGGLGSRSALHYLIERLYWPMVRQWGHGGFEVIIGGTGEIPEWTWKAISHGKYELVQVGFIENLDAAIAQSHAVLVPISAPVGNRSRILTAMGKGALVIAHRNCALGNPDLDDGYNCYLAATPAEFIEKMQLAVTTPYVASIGKHAAAMVRYRFRPESVLEWIQ